ncbi:hypothetical protein DEN75_004553, partial [Escherichia coli]|nr:hypothetical protein [Escherichia coli]
TINKIATIRRIIHNIQSADRPDIEAGTLNLTQELFEVIGFRNVDMAELRIHTPAERVAIAEGHLFRVAFAIFFQLSQAAEFQDVPLFPGVFFFPATRSVYNAVLTWIFRVLILLSPLSCFQPPSSFEFREPRF